VPITDVECLDRLHRAGWTIGDTAFRWPGDRLVRLVVGYNGENQIRAEGATSAEAWLQALEQEGRLTEMLEVEEGLGRPLGTEPSKECCTGA
jgi:hypothetical protein